MKRPSIKQQSRMYLSKQVMKILEKNGCNGTKKRNNQRSTYDT